MFSSMPTSFPPLKTATKPNFENQPPYAAVSNLMKPQHMVVFLTLEKSIAPAGHGKSPVCEPGRKLIYIVFICHQNRFWTK